ncbi:hypothetical protein SAMN04487958_110117 [Vreelandella subterranea]|uniref:Uncharacterized protein n=1 Tax=Vreelandella subterranea TaxID=416874 RepID=A0A1H9VRK2_9GAMM|nr:hypothetical protein [Halomonas subterranea]SES24366.1 hypothetical protein SAMN04487958_110117 [Halomonas subterranea]
MTTYSDETLEQYADRFVQLRLARHGVNLAQYLANPVQFERLALEPEPLLPAQQAAVLRIWQRWDTGLAEQPVAAQESSVPDWDWDWRDLLDRWHTETEQAERAVARMQQRNGAYVEPLHHHRHNRGNARTTANFERKQTRKGA